MTTKNNKDIWHYLSSVLNGNSAEEDMQYVRRWIEEDEKNKALFSRLNDTKYNLFIEEKQTQSKEYIFIKTQAKIKEAYLRSKLYTWRSVAAASVILLLAATSYLLFYTPADRPIMVESKSPAGGIVNLTLDDGTVVALNASSTIGYPLHFDKKNRSVNLDGEAYFKVAKDQERPFIVETKNLKIKVLGTHFNLKSYNDDEKEITTLEEGSVNVEIKNADRHNSQSVVLTPGQQIILNKATGETKIYKVDAGLYASWKDGQCFFENEKFIDIAKILERQFGVTIKITSPNLENQLYSGFFGKKDGVLQILNYFKKYRNFNYKQNDSGIEIYEE